MELTVQYFGDCPNWTDLVGRLRELTAGRRDVTIWFEAVETAEQAERVGFVGSPTLLVDGRDPFAEPGRPVGLSAWPVASTRPRTGRQACPRGHSSPRCCPLRPSAWTSPGRPSRAGTRSPAPGSPGARAPDRERGLMPSSTSWPGYLRSYHDSRPGITDELLRRCGPDPYSWLLEGVEVSGLRVLDLACGRASAWAGRPRRRHPAALAGRVRRRGRLLDGLADPHPAARGSG